MSNEVHSHESNAGRAGLSASGSYTAPYKLEPLMTGLIFGVFGAVALLIFLFAVQFARKNIKNDSSDIMLLMTVAVILIIVEALVVFTAILLVRILRGGYKCSYISDGERFITNEGGNTRIIYFQDVQSVNFFSRTVFGKVRGYDVNVRLNGRDETYSIVSDGFISEKSTPFFIITERVEQMRREQSRTRYEEELSKLGVLDLTAPLQDNSVSEQDISVSNKKSSAPNRLGQDTTMPALNLSAMAAAVSEQEKQSPSQNANTNKDSYIDENGREQLYSDIIGTGRFKVFCDIRKTAALAAVGAAALGFSIFINVFVVNEVLLIAGIAIAVLMGIIIMLGDECTYRANGREFVVTDKKGGETHIVYSDVQTVHYLDMFLGYKVEILTQYGIVSFKCLDKRNRIYQKPEKLPFNIIEKRIK